ncbi:MAG: hypothetical protein GY820_07285, partial [Gammaproteobacteria bacterium]|nr:hypothetical protein [Gammaproteobacteria bacterium]
MEGGPIGMGDHLACDTGLELKIADFDIFANLGGKSVSDLTESIKNEIAMSDLLKKL